MKFCPKNKEAKQTDGSPTLTWLCPSFSFQNTYPKVLALSTAWHKPSMLMCTLCISGPIITSVMRLFLISTSKINVTLLPLLFHQETYAFLVNICADCYACPACISSVSQILGVTQTQGILNFATAQDRQFLHEMLNKKCLDNFSNSHTR